MATNYERGRYYEYKSMRWLEQQGYTCFRTAGSHGLCDVVAVSAYLVLLVQVKFNCTPTRADVEQLELLPVPAGVAKIFHIWKKGAREPWLRTLTTLKKEAA